jgi:peptide/nickel transport system permease protein
MHVAREHLRPGDAMSGEHRSLASSLTSLLASLRRQRLAVLVAGGILLVHVIVAVTGPLWAPYAPDALLVGDPFERPSRDHLFGTDNFGRDVFSRVVYGERTVLGLSLTAAGLAVIAGSALGLLMAYVRGWIDEVVMRGVDVVMTIPPLILSLLILGGVGASYPVIIATVAFFFAARVATVIRAAALDVVSEDFVTAARLRGESAPSIARRELLPNVTSSVLVEFSLRTGYAVLFIAGLSFLGFGSAPPTPDWGLMINEGRQYISSASWLVLAPSLALASLVIALSLFTNGISDALGLSPFRKKAA